MVVENKDIFTTVAMKNVDWSDVGFFVAVMTLMVGIMLLYPTCEKHRHDEEMERIKIHQQPPGQ
jgi:hypothetical protein